MAINHQLQLSLNKSRFRARIVRRYGDYSNFLGGGSLCREMIAGLIDRLLEQFNDLGIALRVARQLLLARIIEWDYCGQISLAEVSLSMTWMAEEALARAHQQSLLHLNQLHGTPIDKDGVEAKLAIVGMGKFGARELNASSDVDLVYLYDVDGETTGIADGSGRISNEEFFAKVVRAIFGLIAEVTEHGFVFRIDIALRPNGNSGASVTSLGALEEYFRTQGREWERFAWLKSRIVAPSELITQEFAKQLRSIVTPFVFRRYLDYGVFDALRQLHRQIRNHHHLRSVQRSYSSEDIKLGKGGIREVEFTVQLLQVVRGGQFPELRTRQTVRALKRLTEAGIMTQQVATELTMSYEFLRRVEHFIQYLDDQQTHILPRDAEDLLWIAQGMGYEQTEAFMQALHIHQQRITLEFELLLGASKAQKESTDLTKPLGPLHAFDALVATLPDRLRAIVSKWRDGRKLDDLSEVAQGRIVELLERLGILIIEQENRLQSAVYFLDWLEPLLRRESYVALLCERLTVLERLLRVLDAAKWPRSYLRTHPGLIDELANPALLVGRFDNVAFERALESRYQSLHENHQDDEESLLNLLRRAQHAEIFRTLARDLEGHLSVEQVADDLSALAVSVLNIATRWCWARMKNKIVDVPAFGIIAYGKLGGLELGYGSDLDLVFVYADADDQAGEAYTQLVRKLINWITIKTGEGDMYEIDTALRPNGNAGLLVTTFNAYANYQSCRVSNAAWTWEHQAITRARCVLGSSDLQEKFATIRMQVLTAVRQERALLSEILQMRERIMDNHKIPEGLFDVKQSRGGMMDIEFVVQYIVLLHARQHGCLLDNLGNTALLLLMGQLGLIPQRIGTQSAKAYRKFRQIQHQARLNEEQPQVADKSVEEEMRAGIDLWEVMFAGESVRLR